MLKQTKSSKSSSTYKHRFVKAANKLLKDIKISPWIGGIIIVLQFCQLILVMLEFDYFELPATYQTIFYYTNLFIPYSLFSTVSLTICFVTIGICLAFIFILYYGFFIALRHQNKSSATFLKLYGIFLYLFEYLFFLPLLGQVLTIYFYSNDFQPGTQIIFMVIYGLLLVLLTIPYVLISMFFFNFSLRTKDAFARGPDLHHFAIKSVFILMVLFDAAIHINYFNLKVVVNLIFSTIICIDFMYRLPYHSYSVMLFYIFSIFFYFWVSLLLLFSVVINVKLIKDNILITIIIGLVLFLWDVYSYKDYLFNRLLNQDFANFSNYNHLERKARYFLVLIKNSKKNTVDELRLASIIQLHIESCRNTDCICKHRASAWNPRKKASADLNAPAFKDFVFLKNLLIVLLTENMTKLFGTPNLNLTYILFLFEELGNFGMADQESVHFFARFHRPSHVAYRFCLARLRLLMRKGLKRLNRQFPYTVNRYENLLDYDRGFDTLK